MSIKLHSMFLFSFVSMAIIVSPVTGVSKVMTTFISPKDKAIEYHGRFDFSNPDKPSFDWPGVYIKTQFEGSSCRVILSGKCRYDYVIDKTVTGTITAEKQDTLVIADSLKKGTHSLLLTKRTETPDHICAFEGLLLDDKCKLIKNTILQKRTIEFIGDSYTAGYGNEHTSRDCADNDCEKTLFMTTNTGKTFGALLGKSFDADIQINAISGKGIIRNYNGVDKGREFLKYYDQVLISNVNTGTPSKLWDFSQWHPAVIVIGLGLNDFLADPPYADSVQYDSAYSKLIDFLRMKHPGAKIICCATDVWPTHALIPRVKKIVDMQKSSGNSDIWYFEYHTENTALHGHPSVADHQKIAKELQPLIAQITGWKFSSF